MKETEKLEYMNSFPALPEHIEKQMNGKSAQNFVVFLTRGDALYVRCYHRYSGGRLAERQRYVFCENGKNKFGFCRYGSDESGQWSVRKEFREPVFYLPSYGYSFANTYTVLNKDAIKKSCMRYSCVMEQSKPLILEYLRLYCRHPNIEYLIKTDYGSLITEEGGYWGGRVKLYINRHINLKSNNLLKMLGLTRTEFKLLQGREHLYDCYCLWRERQPRRKPEELIAMAEAFTYDVNICEKLSGSVGVSMPRLARFLTENNVRVYDYEDYLNQCRTLEYDLTDTAICMPRNFAAAHARLSKLIRYQHDEKLRGEFESRLEERAALEFAAAGLLVRQPLYVDDIAAEGRALCHCVGGYAERHAKGQLHILFIREADNPDKPFYTMELNVQGEIVQVRGLRNRDMTKPVADFVAKYRKYLEKIFGKKKARITA